MKTGQVLKAFDLSNIAVRTMNEKFKERVLQAAFRCMDLGTHEDAAKLSKSQRRIRNYMLSTPVVQDMQDRLLKIATRHMREDLSSDVQRRLAPQNMPGSSTDVAPPPQPPYPPQPDELPPLLALRSRTTTGSTQARRAQTRTVAL